MGGEQFGTLGAVLDDHAEHPGRELGGIGRSPNASEDNGVSGLGRRMTELPAISAGMIFWNAMMIAPL